MSGKQIKHDFSQGVSEQTKNTADTSKIVEMKNKVQQKTSQELVDNNADGVRQFADITIRVLREEMWLMCDITKDNRDQQWNHMYHINKTGVPLQPAKNWDQSWDGQIMLIITKNYKIDVRFNPYWDNPEYIYYHAEWLDTKDYVAELPAFKSFLLNWTVPSTSKLKKDNEGNGRSQGDIDDILAGYDTDPENAKPK